MLKCVNLIEIRFYAYLYASSFFVLWHIIFHSSLLRLIPYLHQTLSVLRPLELLSEIFNEGGIKIISLSNIRPIIAKCQYWLFALRANIRICPRIQLPVSAQWSQRLSIGKPRVSPLRFLNTSAVIRYLICIYTSHFFAGRPYHFNQTLRTANKF